MFNLFIVLMLNCLDKCVKIVRIISMLCAVFTFTFITFNF